MSDVILGYDHVSKQIDLTVNGEKLENVSAINVAASKTGSVCTVVFEPGSVNIQALCERLVVAEESSEEN